jgi:hypothetical protein
LIVFEEPDSRLSEEAGAALARAVENDARRYRRLLLTYAALLVVPILAGIWIWRTGIKQKKVVENIKLTTTKNLSEAKKDLEAETEEVREQINALLRPPVPVETASQEPTPEIPSNGYFLAAFADPKTKEKLVGWNVRRPDGRALKSVSELVNSEVKPLIVMVIREREPTVEQITSSLSPLPPAIGFIRKEESVTVQEIKPVETKQMIQVWAKVAIPKRPLPDKQAYAVIVAVPKPDSLVQKLKEKGYNPQTRGPTTPPNRNQTILVGTDVPFEYAVEVLQLAESFPALKFWDFGVPKDRREIYFGALSSSGAAEFSSQFFHDLKDVRLRSDLFSLKEKYTKPPKS